MFGLTLSSEEHAPRRLVDIAGLAEEHGFDFVSISDHYHPWIDEQGHSPFVWSVLGAIAERTSAIDVAVGVTCPIIRIHPAVLAQAAATTGHLLAGRFTWGVGTGEALNEHITGQRWPIAPDRIDMLEEAIDVIRRLWTGDEVTARGQYYTVENARIYDPPSSTIPIVVSAFGSAAAEMAARAGDGLWTGGDPEIIDTWRRAGGRGPVYSQISLCWAPTRDEAVERAHRVWPNTGVPGQLSQDLPTPAHFEQAASVVTKEMIAEAMVCGPDVEAIITEIRDAVAAGVNHVYLHQIGDDQEGFCKVWSTEIAPEVGSR
jgi:coenzyme F420-dependent glucose-6-phosphate dehydrogenase